MTDEDPTVPAPAEAGDAPLEGAAYLRLVGLGVLIGIPAALVAAGFLGLVHALEDTLWSDDPDWYLVLSIPVAGALIVLAARRFLPGDGGHSPLLGIGGGVVPLVNTPGIVLAAIGSLAFGAVLGPEAPLIALGAVTGLAVGRLVTLGPREEAIVATAGSFSAVSALFGGPLVAAVLLLEASVGLGAAAIPLLLPGLVAAAVGYVLFTGLGDWTGLPSTPLSVAELPQYDATGVLDLLAAVAVGVVTAFLIVGVRRIATAINAHDTPGGNPLLMVGGALAVGMIALVAEALGGTTHEVLFSGQAAVPALLAESSAGVILVLIVAKALAFAICLSIGFRGGPVFPAIFVGVGVAALAAITFDLSPTLALAVGAAAGMASMTRMLFASVLFAALLVGKPGLDAVPAAVLAAAAAWLVLASIDPPKPADPAAPEPTPATS